MGIAREHYPLLTAICASLFTTPLMMAGVNAVLPEIGSSFHASGTELGLVGACYSLGLAVFQLVAGSLGDINGHRRIFLAGALLFSAASALGAFLGNIWIFLAARTFQGIGGALLSASGLALLALSASPTDRPAYLGLSGAAVYAGIACGPALAGFITATFGWRWIFWLNAFCCVCIFFGMKYGTTINWRPAPKGKFDWPGALFYFCAMGGLTTAASKMNQNAAIGWFGIAAFMLFLGIFLYREKSAPFPVLDLKLLKSSRILQLSAFSAFGNYASIFGLLFYFSFFLQTVLGLNVETAGLVLGIQPLSQMAMTPIATRLSKQFQSGYLAAAGSGFCASGLLVVAFLTPASPLWILIGAQILLGSGISLFSLANTNIIIESGGKNGIGQTAAITGAVRTAGQLLSMIFVTLSIGYFLGSQAISPTTQTDFMESMKSSLLIFGCLNMAGIGCSLYHIKKK